MTISFPNTSRHYDPRRRCVRFLGHDDMREISFGVSQDALVHLAPRSELGEDGYLDAFDYNREQIFQAASRLYRRGSQVWYTLTASHF